MKKLNLFNKLVVVLLLGAGLLLIFQEPPAIQKADLVGTQTKEKTLALADNQLAPDGYAEDLYQSRQEKIAKKQMASIETVLTSYSWYEKNQGILNFDGGLIKQIVYGNFQETVGTYRTSADQQLFVTLGAAAESKVTFKVNENQLTLRITDQEDLILRPLLKVSEEH